MKKTLGILFGILFMLSCSNDGETTKTSFSIIGEWIHYKETRVLQNSDLPMKYLDCGVYGSDFDCGVAIVFFTDGTAKIPTSGETFPYTYKNGFLEYQNMKAPLREVGPNEFALYLTYILNGTKYDMVRYYKKK